MNGPLQIDSVVKHFHLFCGIGGGALGFNKAKASVGRLRAKMRCLGGVDVDARAIRDFTSRVGVPGTVLDLFDRAQYELWHGKAPPSDWREATILDILRAAGFEHPDIVFLSAPCKGFSGLQAEARAASARYQALNALTVRGVRLMLEAFEADPPGLIAFENVPRIASRGADLIDEITALLELHGYVVVPRERSVHDCGELGGLAQHRRRFLLVARHRTKVPPFLYEPPKQRVKAVGEVLRDLWMPDDPAAGPMHRVPRLTWQTWMRLALIPAGKDWRTLRDLAVVDGYLRDLVVMPVNTDWHGGALGVRPWSEPVGTMTGRSLPTNGAFTIADPRLKRTNGYNNVYRVVSMDETSPAVTGGGCPSAGGLAVADPRLQSYGEHTGKLHVQRFDEPGRTVICSDRVGSGAGCIADPRLQSETSSRTGRENAFGQYGVLPWTEPGPTITAQSAPGGGPFSVADPRCHGSHQGNGKYKVIPMDEPAGTVIAESHTGQGAYAVADPRVAKWAGKVDYVSGGHYGVVPWEGTAGTVSAHGQADNGKHSVADPRLPAPHERPDPTPWIWSLDNTRHRPLTTLEMGVLQGWDAADLVTPLDGRSDARWREGLGNMVPILAAEAIGSAFADALLRARASVSFQLRSDTLWVRRGFMAALSVDLPAKGVHFAQ